MKQVAACAFVSLIALSVLSGCGGSAKKVAVRVNKDTVTEDEFYRRVEDVSVADLAPAARGLGPGRAGEFTMEHLIIELLLKQLAEQKGIKPTEAEISQYITVAKKYQSSPILALLAQNPYRTDDDFKREASLNLIQRGLAMAPLKIPESEITKKYEELKTQLTPEDQYHLRVITTTSKEKSQKVLDTLAKGVAFETVALTQSEEPTSRAKSGDIGVVPQGALPPQLLGAVKDLKPNEYTKTAVQMSSPSINPAQPAPPTQFLVAQLVEKLPGKPPTLQEARYVVERFLLNEKDPGFSQRIQADLATMRKSADIQVNLDKYKKLVDQIKTSAAPPSQPTPAGR